MGVLSKGRSARSWGANGANKAGQSKERGVQSWSRSPGKSVGQDRSTVEPEFKPADQHH